jgi:polysaccharide biosynthesis/export protein
MRIFRLQPGNELWQVSTVNIQHKRKFFGMFHKGRSLLCCALLFAIVALLLLPDARAQFSGPAPGQSVESSASSSALLHADRPAVTLRPGDLLEIHIFGLKDFSEKIRLGTDGTAPVQLVGPLKLSDLTIEQAESKIARSLIDGGMIKQPWVSVDVLESPTQVITVTGEVKNPGVVPGYGERRLLEVISASGGFTAQASRVITVSRPGSPQSLTVALGSDPSQSESANIPIFPGDTIIVPQIGVVYLVGAFKNQGAFPLKSATPLSLSQAVALGGGMDYQGIWNDTMIIRKVDGTRKELKFDVKKILAGKQPDPSLHPDDIIFVPTSKMRASIKGGAFQAASSLVIGLGYALN